MNILLVINTNNVFEINSGSALRNNLFLKSLCEIGYVDLICFSQNNIVSNVTNCDVVYSEIINDFYDYKEVCRTLWCMTFHPSDPYSYFRLNKQKATIIDGFINKKKYDLIACRYLQAAILCGLLKYKDILMVDGDDNLANYLKVRKTSSTLINWRHLYESKRIKRMLKNVFSNIRYSFCSNPQESPSPQTVWLHNTSVLNPPAPNLTNDTLPRILFVGFLRYYPNKEGITHFVESIFPHIKEAIPQAELQIVGDGRPEFLDYLNKNEGVNAVGRVDDLASEYQKAAVVVIPIYSGTGTCVKFSEALLMNRPVISSLVGARGFCEVCRDGEDYMLAHNDEEFISKTIQLLSSIPKLREMANKGYEIGKKYFSQEKFKEIVKRTIQES